MALTVSAAVLFVLLMLGTIRYAAHKPGHALIAFLAGFFIATSPAAPTISAVIAAVARALGRI